MPWLSAPAHRLVRRDSDRDGRIFIERVNEPFLAAAGSGEQFRAGFERAVALGWLRRHESGTYLKITEGRRCSADPRLVTAKAHPHRFRRKAQPASYLLEDRKLNLETLSFQKACDDPVCDRK